MPRWRSFVQFPLVLLTGAVVGSCEPDHTLTQADPGISPVPEMAEAASAASPRPSEGGAYVATCETSYRPVWFRGERRPGSVRVAIPARAVDAAHGHQARFRYRRYDLRGELSHTAECVIPYSDEAIRIAVVRFSLRSALPDSLWVGGASGSGLAGEPPLGGPVVLGDHCGTPENPCEVELDPIGDLCEDFPNDPECQEQQDDPGGEDDPPPPDDEPPCDPTWDDSCGGGGSGPDPGDGDPEACDSGMETCEPTETGWDAEHTQGDHLVGDDSEDWVCPPTLHVTTTHPLRLRHWRRFGAEVQEWWFWTWGSMHYVESAGGGGFGIAPRAWYSIPQGPWSAIAGESHGPATLWSGQVRAACRLTLQENGTYAGSWWILGTRNMVIDLHP